MPRTSKLHLIDDFEKEITMESLKQCIIDIRAARNCKSRGILPVMFVIDKAACLIGKYCKRLLHCKQKEAVIKVDYYRLFRRVLWNSEFFWENCFLCLISTTSLISNIMPSQADDPSWRPVSGVEIKLLPPFTVIHTFDYFEQDFFLIGSYKCGVDNSLTIHRMFVAWLQASFAVIRCSV